MFKRTGFILLMFFMVILSLLPAQAGGPLWTEQFESYPTGANMHGLGGWKGWLNDPTFTAYTSNEEAWSGWNSLEISATADLVHEYSVHSGRVRYGFYQFIPRTFRGRSIFIMLNQYDDEGTTNNWSVQVSYSNATGQMVDNGASGASMPYVGDRWVWVCIDIDLDNDTQAFIYDGILFYTGSWSNHVSGGGSTSIAAVDLYANGGSSVYYDGMIMDTGYCSQPPEPPPFYRLHLPLVIRQ